MKRKNFFGDIAIPIVFFVSCLSTLNAEEPWFNVEDLKTEVCGVILDLRNNPVPGADVRCDFFGTYTQSDEQGRFSLKLQNPEYRRLRVVSSDRTLVALSGFLGPSGKDADTGEYRITLTPPRKLTGKVVDENGTPIPGAAVWSTTVQGTTDISTTDNNGEFELLHCANSLLQSVAARDAKAGLDLLQINEKQPDKNNNGPFTIPLTGGVSARFKVVDENNTPVPQAKVSAWYFQGKDNKSINPAGFEFLGIRTNEQGIAVLEGLPNWTTMPAGFIAFDAKNNPKLLSQRIELDLQNVPPETLFTLSEGVFVRGTVSLPDGSPAPLWNIQLSSLSGGHAKSSKTDFLGRYSILVEKDQDLTLSVQRPDIYSKTEPAGAASLRHGLETGQEGLSGVDVQLQKPVRVFGKILGNPPPNGKGRISHFNIFELKSGKIDPNYFNGNFTSVDENDHYQTWLAPGKYVLRFRGLTFGHSENVEEKIEITDQKELEINFDNTKYIPRMRPVRLRVALPDLEKDAKAMANAEVVFFQEESENPIEDREFFSQQHRTDENGELQVDLPQYPLRVFVLTSDRRFGACEPVPGEGKEMEIVLQPTVSARGRLMKENEVDQPMKNAAIDISPRGFYYSSYIQKITDEQGNFEFDGLVPGAKYSIRLPIIPRDWPDPKYADSWYSIHEEKAEPGKDMDVGKIFKSTDLGIEEMHWAFVQVYRSTNFKTFEPLFQEYLSRAKNDGRRILVLFSEINHESINGRFVNNYLAWRLFGDADVKPYMARYYFMGIPTDKTPWFGESRIGEAKAFAARHGIPSDAVEQITLCEFDADGKLLNTSNLLDVMEPTADTEQMQFRVNKERLIELLHTWNP